MYNCSRNAYLVEYQDGYVERYSRIPVTEARDFALPGDISHYAPDRPVDILHIKLELALDMEQESLSGVASTTCRVLYEKIYSIILDGIDLSVDCVTLLDGTVLQTANDGRKIIPNVSSG